MIDIVGEKEIALRLRVPANTVHQWQKRDLLPPPEGSVSGMPAWRWATVLSWAKRTGRVGHRQHILLLLDRHEEGGTSAIWNALRSDGYSCGIGQVQRLLTDLLEESLVSSVGGGKWRITATGRRMATTLAADGEQRRCEPDQSDGLNGN